MYERPDVNDEDLGIRAFQIKRGKAVERSIQLIRHGLGASWRSLTAEEIEELEWILGELWAYLAHTVWDELHFGLLTMSDIVKVLTFGSQLRRHAHRRQDPVQASNRRRAAGLIRTDGSCVCSRSLTSGPPERWPLASCSRSSS